MLRSCELEHIARGICSDNNHNYVRFIAAGAFKETYQIQDDKIYYALKVFKANNQTERIDREIDAMKRLNSQNIACLHKVDSYICPSGTFLYLYEEYLPGGTLTEMMNRNGCITKKGILSIGRDLITALEATYNERIVHRDIKPDNIMFRGEQTEAVLVDFGLVRDLDAASLTQAHHQRGPGTALYSSPEQLNNQKPLIDWRSDQFSLGITLCEAMLGVHPFDSGNIFSTIDRVSSMKSCNKTTMEHLTDLGLEPLIKMIEPWPIKRFRKPCQLWESWNELEC